ncbi:baseplate J/gp47 family protein [Salinicola sp. LHM]|uniref:baseplate assembly protein n=1 Tax=Salinicola sp. LHM TaxID=3065298 RepID=UPI002ACD9F20|nr:baseplate J/gp47 family protein [Salinicola sp. LHM]WQH33369.1 baseplate J/gp47 family protein [Salinicola sp. LHM]
MSSPIDLSQLPAPDVVETLDYETIFAERKSRLVALYPADEQDNIAARLELESEPLVKLLQENAYRELVLRQRINDAARAVMIATAGGADLENLSALLGVAKLTNETDDELRARTVMALEGYPTAGSVGAYKFHALSAHPDVKDVAVLSPTPGLVRLVILAKSGDGTPSDDVLDAVRQAATADHVRPLTDTVEVIAATITPYAIRATLYVESGPSADTVRAAAEAAVREYAEARRALGAYVALSGIAAALHRAGVRRIEIAAPITDIDNEESAAASLVALELTTEVAS